MWLEQHSEGFQRKKVRGYDLRFKSDLTLNNVSLLVEYERDTSLRGLKIVESFSLATKIM